MSERFAPLHRACCAVTISFSLLLIAAAATAGSPFLDYRTESWFLPQSPTVTGSAAAGLFNPAAFALSDVAGTDFWWNDRSVRGGLDNYGFAAGRTLNFAMNKHTFGDRGDNWRIYDYQLGLAGGSRAGTFGLGYRWSRGETGRTPREPALVVGAASRRRSWLNVGASGVLSLDTGAAQYVFDVGLRPFQKDYLTLHADWSVNDNEAFFGEGVWGAGLEVRPLTGLHFGVRARQRQVGGNVDYSVLVGATLGFTNLTALPLYNQDGRLQSTSFLIRSNPPLPGLATPPRLLGQRQTYYPLNLENKRLTYQKFRYFDDKRVAWLDLLKLLNAVRDDETIKILAVNLAGFDGRPSLLWEFRQKLLEIGAAGKEVIVHTDRTNSRTYYLASAADRITIDPLGSIALPGLALSRSYLKGTLAKLGIGFQAHRYFKYKSAAETLSRDSMSAADREQRQRIVDVIYEELRDGMAAGRNLTPARLDEITDNEGQLLAGEALSAGLVDELTRWDAMLRTLTDQRGVVAKTGVPGSFNRRYWDRQWGQPVRIPVVYAVGVCDMDRGIKGRATSAYLRRLVTDPDVKAVVLRADSPGGDPLPSDLIAAAVRQLREAGKPVIISQGDVAASGGYWISMDGSRILTTPLTITGSIGVISGWVWDDGVAAKAGISSDEVHRGEHADLYANVSLPFVGSLPRRPMNADELRRAETIIRAMYDDFVNAVARGRGLSPATVAAIAEGRVWMGDDAIARGLCDARGGLDQALALARREAGIAPWREVEVVEYPARPLVEWPSFGPRLPGLFGIGSSLQALFNKVAQPTSGAVRPEPLAPAAPVSAAGLSEFDLELLRGLIATRGQGALLVGPDVVPEAWREID